MQDILKLVLYFQFGSTAKNDNTTMYILAYLNVNA